MPRRRFLGELADAALRRMQPQLQRFERAAWDHKLAIQHQTGLGERGETGGNLREVALQRLLVLRLQVDVRA